MEPNSPCATRIEEMVAEIGICDVHTHLFDPAMDGMLQSGIDDLLTYHYHVAELFRVLPELVPEEFFALPRPSQADLVWRELFVERSPLSEVGVGLVGLLSALGLDPGAKDLRQARAYFEGRTLTQRVDEAFALAGVREVHMTDDPLDPRERACWQKGFVRDPRFHAALRLDRAIVDWPAGVPALRALGFEVEAELSRRTLGELERYLREWIGRMGARSMAVSLPPEFRCPDPDAPGLRLLEGPVMVVARDLGLPVSLMIGVRRRVNPDLGLAGDGVGVAEVASLERLVRENPNVRFPVTFLARENQHGLCVAARKFKNIVPFGCWWFVNTQDQIREITTMRLDLLGPTFIPQHSDARVLEQLIFKWRRARAVIAGVLARRYLDLEASGLTVREARVRADLECMFDGRLLGPPASGHRDGGRGRRYPPQ